MLIPGTIQRNTHLFMAIAMSVSSPLLGSILFGLQCKYQYKCNITLNREGVDQAPGMVR